MTGTEFFQAYAGKGQFPLEAAVLETARQGGLTPRSWVPLNLSMTFPNGSVHTAQLQVQEDVLAVGDKEDSIRVPLTPSGAQDVFNLQGWLLPTPWLVYQMWQAAPIKLSPTSIADLGQINRGPDPSQYILHSRFIDRQIAGVLASADQRVTGPELVSGGKKNVVVSNLYVPHKVVIFGWYRPPPAPNVFDDKKSIGFIGRQPVQPHSNVHDAAYLDYSHGIQAVGPNAIVDGQPMRTIDLYQHPTLWRLVSHDGPVRMPRYPARVQPPPQDVPVASAVPAGQHVAEIVSTYPSVADLAVDAIQSRRGGST